MRSEKVRLWGALMAATMAVTMIGVTPTVAQDPTLTQDEECRGGTPAYWLANEWPEAFKVPKAFRKPNGQLATVRPWTKFDHVFRYLKGRDHEGKIFPGKTLKQVMRMGGDSKKVLARQAIASLLNAGETDNEFWPSKYTVIRQFQIYWDGTGDLNKFKARKKLIKRYVQWNNEVCPAL